MTARAALVLAAFLAEMLEKALERIARHDARRLILIIRFGGLGGLDLDRHDRAANVIHDISKRGWRHRLRHFGLRRGSACLAQTTAVHASQSQGSDGAQKHGTNFIAPAQNQRRRLRAFGPAGLDISHRFLHLDSERQTVNGKQHGGASVTMPFQRHENFVTCAPCNASAWRECPLSTRPFLSRGKSPRERLAVPD